MEGGELQGTQLGSVKADISSYKQQILQGNPPAKMKIQTKKPYTEQIELHEAKQTVKDLTQRIEVTNSKARAQIQELEKIKMAQTREEEWNQFEMVMKEVESVKLELSKLKLDSASLLEEKRNAEREMNSSISKALSLSSSVEALTKEIEEINEEHVLVELARIEAFNQYREIEAQRRENAEAYSTAMESTAMEEMQKKKRSLIPEIEHATELETKLAVTKSDLNMLETALIKTEVQEMEAERESAEEKLEAALKNLEAVKSSEAIALENLDAVIQNTIRNRASISQRSTTITISKFEYDYLKSRAGEAIKVADKKVEAAHAWIEALTASEREILIKTDVLEIESRERSVKREDDVMKTEGTTIARRAKVRKSATSTGRGASRTPSFTLRRRK